MDELIKLVCKKTGLPEEQAKQAVTVVIGYLKSHLPAPVASQIDGLLSAGGAAKGIGDAAKGVGGLLRRK